MPCTLGWLLEFSFQLIVQPDSIGTGTTVSNAPRIHTEQEMIHWRSVWSVPMIQLPLGWLVRKMSLLVMVGGAWSAHQVLGFLFEMICLFPAICNAGEYFDEWSKKCRLCPLGTYQEKCGSTACLPCPADSTTTITVRWSRIYSWTSLLSARLIQGAKNASDCSFKCGAGKELAADGRCKPCSRGTYWVSCRKVVG